MIISTLLGVVFSGGIVIVVVLTSYPFRYFLVVFFCTFSYFFPCLSPKASSKQALDRTIWTRKLLAHCLGESMQVCWG